MDEFDLGRLTDYDFEAICQDLFQEMLGVRLELFSRGADAGVDLRRFADDKSQLVIQCKHWMRSGKGALTRHMKNKELKKIKKLAPARYILATSVSLTKLSKDNLAKDLAPYVSGPEDIYGLEEIVGLLRDRPHIVRRHLRLWLSSAAVLQTLLNKAIVLRSQFLLEELDESLKVYAPSRSFVEAQSILEREHMCIIAGIPGIGKTTLARVLAASYAAEGYELIEVSRDADEVLEAWDDQRPQFFYYDDFLGQTTLEDKLHKNEDNRLVTIMRKVGRTPNKRFVLTTREYILAQARQRYEPLARQDFDIYKRVLDLEEYTKLIRAEILYNHVYHSNLPVEQRKLFAVPDNYRRIVGHPNFNPRLVAHSLDIYKNEAGTNVDAVDMVFQNIVRPRRIWEHVVEYDLDDAALNLLEVLFAFGGFVALSDLESAWSAYRGYLGMSDDSRRFRRALDALDNTMVKSRLSHGVIAISFHNPSVRDFMRDYIADGRKTVINLIDSAPYFEQIVNLWTMAEGWEGSKIKTQVHSASDVVERALLRSLKSESSTSFRDDSWIERAAFCLNVSSVLNLDSLAHEVLVHFGENWTENVQDPDEVVSLVRAVGACQVSEAQKRVSDIASNAVDWITADTYNWERVREAIALLEEINEWVPVTVIAGLEEDLLRELEREFDKWSSGKPKDVDWSKVDEMIDFAETYEGFEDTFPGYQVAKSAMDDYRTKNPAPHVNVNDDDDDDRLEEEWQVDGEVDRLMGLLDAD